MKVFIPVSVKDELPDTSCSQHVNVFSSQIVFAYNENDYDTMCGTCYLKIHEKDMSKLKEERWMGDEQGFTHWLKEIELPTKPQMIETCTIKNPYTSINWHAFNKGFFCCEKYLSQILNPSHDPKSK